MQDKSEKAIVDLKGGRIHMYLRALSSSLYPLKLRSPVRCCPLRSAAVPMPWRLPITIVTKGSLAPRRSKTQTRVRVSVRRCTRNFTSKQTRKDLHIHATFIRSAKKSPTGPVGGLFSPRPAGEPNGNTMP